jgi:hypothetical protein
MDKIILRRSLKDIMEKYDLSYLILLVQKAHTIFCYFNVSKLDINKFDTAFGQGSYTASKPMLKIYGADAGGEMSPLIQSAYIDAYADNTFIDIPGAHTKVYAKLCRVTPDNQCHDILTSNIITLPADHISEDSLLEFYSDFFYDCISNMNFEDSCSS